MLKKINDFLFFVIGTSVIVLAFWLLIENAIADTAAESHLKATTVQVNGLSCVGSGSMVKGLITDHAYLLTNEHVCNCAKYKGYIYATREGGELIKARVVKESWKYDLCAARLDSPVPVLLLGGKTYQFEDVETRGYPAQRLTESRGQIKGRADWQYEMPIDQVGTCPAVSQVQRGLNGNIVSCLFTFRAILTSLFSRPGASGSPVVDTDGNLVGVVSSFQADKDYDGGMVPYDEVKNFLSNL